MFSKMINMIRSRFGSSWQENPDYKLLRFRHFYDFKIDTAGHLQRDPVNFRTFAYFLNPQKADVRSITFQGHLSEEEIMSRLGR